MFFSKKRIITYSLPFGVVITVLAGFYLFSVVKINKEYYEKYFNDSLVSLRKFPYPYKAAIAISNDIDNTQTLEEFLEIHKFLNTTEMTNMGEGLGLEIGNSFFFYEPPTGAISYFLGGPKVAQTIRDFIDLGYIDVMHSYGKKYDFTRYDAIEALKKLENLNSKICVWVDHTTSTDNLGDDFTFGLGDHPGSEEYHADLTLAYGIKFAWLGKVTMIIGQGVALGLNNFIDIYDSDHPFNSMVNLCKEFTKHILAIFGNQKYAIHKKNDLVKITELDDGQKVYEFIRFDNYWKGVGTGANSKRLSYVISNKTLNRLKENGGYMIVYTHFGKNSNCFQYICKDTQNALLNLAKEFEKGNIYVTKTSKLLKYFLNHKYLDWSYETKEGVISIQINKVDDPIFGSYIPIAQDLEGVTFYVPNGIDVSIYLNNKRINYIKKNPADYTGRQSIKITNKLS